MKFPEFLGPNGTIGFVAPAFGCNIEPYKSAFGNAQNKFKALGYSVDLGPNCYEGKGIGISNTPKACGEELTEYYCSEKNDVLISCGGGELMCETLDYVDFDKIKAARPKWYMGFSDNTNFTFLLTTICDVASLYAPCAAAYGMEPWHAAVQDAFDVLTGKKHVVKGYPSWEIEGLKSEENPLAPYNVTEEKILRYYLPGLGLIGSKEDAAKKADATGEPMLPSADFEGRLVGGCMDCLANLIGTDFDKVAEFNERYKEEGVVWFLEACDLNVMSIRRTLWSMEHAGWFQNVKGFLIGRPLCFGSDMFGLDQYSAVTGILGKYNVPIIMDADIGHLSPMMPLICGSHAKITAVGNEIEVEMTNGTF